MISNFAQGDAVEDFFVLVSATLIPYDRGERLRIELSDATGKIEGVIWDSASAIYEQIKESEIIKVRGLVTSYRDRPQLKVEKIRPATESDEIDLTRLIKVVPGGIEAQIERFNQLLSTIEDPFISELIRLFKADSDLFERYSKAPAGKRWHHAYLGGLIQHSVSMAELAAVVCDHYEELNRDLVVCGAFFHDVGKIFELSGEAKLDYTDKGRLIGHITLGDQLISSLIAKIPDFPEKLEFKIRHSILAHHGSFELGSPVKPQIREAFILHLLDLIDSGMNVFGRYDASRDGEWTDWVNLWERYLYFG